MNIRLGKIDSKIILDIAIQNLDGDKIDASVKLALLTVLAGYLEKDDILVNGKQFIDKKYLGNFLSYILNDKRAAPRSFNLDIKFDNKVRNIKNNNKNDNNLIISFSGGIDSTAGLLHALDRKMKVKPVFICFGQKNEKDEILSVKKILKKLNIVPLIINIDINKYMDHEWERWKMGIVPARNYLFAAVAGSILSSSNNSKPQIWICAHKEEINIINTDKSTRFFSSTTKILSKMYKKEISVSTPFKDITKPEIISFWKKEWEKRYGILITDTNSCYLGNNCGICKACVNRAIAFSCAGIELEKFKTNPFFDKEGIIQKAYIDRFSSLKKERRTDFVYALWLNRNYLPESMKSFIDKKYMRNKLQIRKRIKAIKNFKMK